MAEGYEIVEHETECGNPILVLRPEGSRDFLEKMAANGKTVERYRLIVRAVSKIQIHGPRKFMGHMVRQLDDELSLFEIKVSGKVIRVMAYIRQPYGPYRIVLLFDFDGHQGTGKITKSDIKRGKRLARIARACLKEE